MLASRATHDVKLQGELGVQHLEVPQHSLSSQDPSVSAAPGSVPRRGRGSEEASEFPRPPLRRGVHGDTTKGFSMITHSIMNNLPSSNDPVSWFI